MKLQYAILALHEQLKKFENVEYTGERYFGDNLDEIISSGSFELDSHVGKIDVTDPILDALETVIPKDYIRDSIDSEVIELLYRCIIAKPDRLLVNGIYNYIMNNKERFSMDLTDDASPSDLDILKQIKSILNIDPDLINIMYFLKDIVRNILINEPKFSELDFHINTTLFKKFKDLNIYGETNVYYSELIATNLLHIDNIVDYMASDVAIYIREGLDIDDLLRSTDILSYLL